MTVRHRGNGAPSRLRRASSISKLFLLDLLYVFLHLTFLNPAELAVRHVLLHAVAQKN